MTIYDELERDDVVSLADLERKRIRPTKYYIRDLVPEGLTILGGIPKSGKSWLGLNLCLSVAAGAPALGCFETEKTNALYIGLEDSFGRIQNRVRKIRNYGDGPGWPPNFHVKIQIPMVQEGGLKILDELCWQYDTEFIVVDTFFHFTGIVPKQGASNYQADYKIMAEMQNFALKNRRALIVIHHTKKGEIEDEHFVSKISGTHAITGGSDSVIVLEWRKKKAKISVTGRDVPEDSFDASFKGEFGVWSVNGEYVEERLGAKSEKAYELIAKSDKPVTIVLLKALMKEESYDAVKQLVYGLKRKGYIDRMGQGYIVKQTIPE